MLETVCYIEAMLLCHCDAMAHAGIYSLHRRRGRRLYKMKKKEEAGVVAICMPGYEVHLLQQALK